MRFRLVRHFTLTSLALFLAVGCAIVVNYREMAVSRMIRQQESNNVNLTRVFANALWQEKFAGLLAASSQVPSSKLKFLSQIPEIHREVLALMRGSTTYKIKVYDPLGRTVYSSEPAQIGEDKRDNRGFLGALAGQTRTELVHKEKFSAFEQTVENRDLIQSYIPQYGDDPARPAGVFEIYSDVTPFLEQIDDTETRLILLIAAALGGLFAAQHLLVRRAERLIERQAEAHRHAQQQLAQAEKMASLGQLVAGVSHQLNTPIAFSHSNVSLAIAALDGLELPARIARQFADLAGEPPDGQRRMHVDLGAFRPALASFAARLEDVRNLRLMLGDVLHGLEQMRELVHNLRDFTRLDRSKVSDTDLNETLGTVIYIARSATSPGIEIVEAFEALPKITCNPSQLNQVFLNLITNAAQAIAGSGRITVRTRQADGHVLIEVSDTGGGISDDVLPHIFEPYFTTKPKGVGTGLGLSIARDIVRNHGGELSVAPHADGATFRVSLPLAAPAPFTEP